MPGSNHNQPKPKILLVDDEYQVLFTLKAILERNGYDVRGCVHAHEAIAAVEEESFDLAILDYLLPDLRGDEIAIRLKEACPALPIIFMSAFHVPEAAKKLAEVSLSKPELPSILLEAVRVALKCCILL